MFGRLQNNVYMVHNAISDSKTVVKLGKHIKNMGGTYVDDNAEYIKEMKHGLAQGTYGLVNTITIDDLLDLPIIAGFQKVFIKIDIEGFEDRAIKMSHNFFTKIDVRGVIMEWIFHKGMDTAKTIIRFMQEYRFRPYSFNCWINPLNFNESATWPNDVLWLPEDEFTSQSKRATSNILDEISKGSPMGDFTWK